jgi:hypothetical protein
MIFLKQKQRRFFRLTTLPPLWACFVTVCNQRATCWHFRASMGSCCPYNLQFFVLIRPSAATHTESLPRFCIRSWSTEKLFSWYETIIDIHMILCNTQHQLCQRGLKLNRKTELVSIFPYDAQ